MHIGEPIGVRAYKADGKVYRWWQATVESISAEGIVTYALPGHAVEGTDRSWISGYSIRAHYWYDRPYNLLEVYLDDQLHEIYIHIASPMTLEGDNLVFTDYELDVVKQPGKPAWIEDEDEFAEAAERYSYSAEFQAACYQTVAEILPLAVEWEERVSK